MLVAIDLPIDPFSKWQIFHEVPNISYEDIFANLSCLVCIQRKTWKHKNALKLASMC